MVKTHPGISLYEQTLGRFWHKIHEISTFQGHFTKISEEKVQNSTNNRRAKRAAKFFTIVHQFYFSKPVFSSVFLWFSDFFQEFRGGHVPPCPPPLYPPLLLSRRRAKLPWKFPRSNSVRSREVDHLSTRERGLPIWHWVYWWTKIWESLTAQTFHNSDS